jgi:hypothetical protein
MDNLQIRISNIENVFTIDKKESLISFLGRVLFNASLASSKDATDNQTATINGKVYTFKNKVINVNTESLPKVERVTMSESSEALKNNFIGFCLNTLFGGVTTFKGANIHKNKAINLATENCTSLVAVVTVLLRAYKEKQVERKNETLQGEAMALQYKVGTKIETLLKINKELATTIKAAKTANIESYAKLLNAATKAAKVEATIVATV